GLIRSIAIDYAPQNIRANVVTPGVTDTPGLRKVYSDGRDLEESMARAAGQSPLGRLARIEDVAEMIAFVCGTRASFVNGSELLEGFAPTVDATVVTRLLDAGATIVGKTAVPAFCFEGTGIFGYPEPLTLNPFDADLYPGASSSGSAAVVANGEADLALG